jgi:hypothetical protein
MVQLSREIFVLSLKLRVLGSLAILLFVPCWGQNGSLLRLTAVTGQLQFPTPTRFPDWIRAEQAPQFVIEDFREVANGYTLHLQLSPFHQQLPSSLVRIAAQPLLTVRSLDATYGRPPEIVQLSSNQTLEQSTIVLRASRIAHHSEGQGRWLIQIQPNSLQMQLPRYALNGLHRGQLQIQLRNL